MSSSFDDAVNTGPQSPSRKAAPAPDSEAKLRAGHRSRLRARFLADPSAMPDHEVLELLLGYVRVRHDNKILARRLLQRFGSLSGVLSAPDAERGLVPDSGEGVDVFCALIREIIARSAQSAVQKKARVSLVDIGTAAAGRLRLCSDEEVWAALLDKKNSLASAV
jgi:DNA repair protein RadC